MAPIMAVIAVGVVTPIMIVTASVMLIPAVVVIAAVMSVTAIAMIAGRAKIKINRGRSHYDRRIVAGSIIIRGGRSGIHRWRGPEFNPRQGQRWQGQSKAESHSGMRRRR